MMPVEKRRINEDQACHSNGQRIDRAPLIHPSSQPCPGPLAGHQSRPAPWKSSDRRRSLPVEVAHTSCHKLIIRRAPGRGGVSASSRTIRTRRWVRVEHRSSSPESPVVPYRQFTNERKSGMERTNERTERTNDRTNDRTARNETNERTKRNERFLPRILIQSESLFLSKKNELKLIFPQFCLKKLYVPSSFSDGWSWTINPIFFNASTRYSSSTSPQICYRSLGHPASRLQALRSGW